MWDIWSDPIINKLITLIADHRKTFSSWFSEHCYQEIICNMFLLEVAVDSIRYGSWLQFEINVFCTPLFQLYCVLTHSLSIKKNKHQIFFYIQHECIVFQLLFLECGCFSFDCLFNYTWIPKKLLKARYQCSVWGNVTAGIFQH